ncbi:hypothetical protein PoB_003152600 [Plakobranchus ocellatus]|uniref:Uncharacterized protein n=1 Tax=Plakobranchus ocellatus TaxID=259542 RepID=A0AAV4A1C4_9GAST|nr:hypothetical protein PoB_003152600 [Plakobranchus ocellatus]
MLPFDDLLKAASHWQLWNERHPKIFEDSRWEMRSRDMWEVDLTDSYLQGLGQSRGTESQRMSRCALQLTGV